MNAIVTYRPGRPASVDPAPLPVSAVEDSVASGVDLEQYIALTRQEYLFCGDGTADGRASGNSRLRSFLTRRARRSSAALPASAIPPARGARNGESPKSLGKATARPGSGTGGGALSSWFGRIVNWLGLWAAGAMLLATVGILATKYKVVLIG